MPGKCKELKADCYLAKNVASLLKDYEKIPEGAVVLTGEELEQRDKEIKELKIANNNLIFQLQCHDDEVQRLIKENGKLRFERDFAQKIARKETAREVLKKVDEESNWQTIMVTNYIRMKYGIGVE